MNNEFNKLDASKINHCEKKLQKYYKTLYLIEKMCTIKLEVIKMPSMFDDPKFKPLEKVSGKIAINVRGTTISFTKQFISQLSYPKYVQVFVNNSDKLVGIRPCSETDPNALKFVPVDKNTVDSVRWNNPTFTKNIRSLVFDIFPDEDFTCLGEYIENENAILLNMSKATLLS